MSSSKSGMPSGRRAASACPWRAAAVTKNVALPSVAAKSASPPASHPSSASFAACRPSRVAPPRRASSAARPASLGERCGSSSRTPPRSAVTRSRRGRLAAVSASQAAEARKAASVAASSGSRYELYSNVAAGAPSVAYAPYAPRFSRTSMLRWLSSIAAAAYAQPGSGAGPSSAAAAMWLFFSDVRSAWLPGAAVTFQGWCARGGA
mmetsp:Transcript_17673/g.44845  ORF Transcript_17673/g.44845 Transcript_17673/m.44845 type:complete len:207 (-) Transcript_17673:168-788(-)